LNDKYIYEPANLEIITTEMIANTLAKPYYRSFVEKLSIKTDDKVLDYCSHELINLLEHTKKLEYEYKVIEDGMLGEYVDIVANRKKTSKYIFG
jgi:hypothetical protein